jgi:uncharacterized protein (DUF433 family)
MRMDAQYVEEVDGAYRIAGTRVSLDSVVYGFLRGESAEAIAQNFPALTLEQVYGGIAFYLANRAEVDAYLERRSAEYEKLRQQSRDQDPAFYQKWADRKRQLAVR